jgi:hypothetical protein
VRFRFVGGNFVRRSMSLFAVMTFVVPRCVASSADADSDVNRLKNFLERVAGGLSRRRTWHTGVILARFAVKSGFAVFAERCDAYPALHGGVYILGVVYSACRYGGDLFPGLHIDPAALFFVRSLP